MQLFSTFKLYSYFSIVEGYKEMYDTVVYFNRDWFYLAWKGGLPLIGLGCIVYVLSVAQGEFLRWIAIIISIPAGLYRSYLLARYTINYFLDFVIVIPGKVIIYNQIGVFRRDIMTIENIAVILVLQKGLDQSVFNYGTLEFYSANDGYGYIYDWVHDPEEQKMSIEKVLKSVG